MFVRLAGVFACVLIVVCVLCSGASAAENQCVTGSSACTNTTCGVSTSNGIFCCPANAPECNIQIVTPVDVRCDCGLPEDSPLDSVPVTLIVTIAVVSFVVIVLLVCACVGIRRCRQRSSGKNDDIAL